MALRLCVGILAGGESRRMGRDKAFLTVGGRRFIDILAGELAPLGPVTVSAARPGLYEGLGCPVVYDARPGLGPLEGLRQILAHAPGERVFVCAVDMPFLKKEVAAYLAEFVSSDYDAWCLTTGGRLQPLCAIYSTGLLPAVEEALAAGRLRLADALGQARVKEIPVEWSRFGARVAMNVNTPAEYARLNRPWVFCVSGWKNSGKTTLAAGLIRRFAREGFAVAAIKHDGHDFAMDREGTDTSAFRRAGAGRWAIFSGAQFALGGLGAATAEDLIALCPGADVIIIEGLKYSAFPKVALTGDVAGPVICQAAPGDDVGTIFESVKKYFTEGNR